MHQVWPSASNPHPSTLPAHTTNGQDQTVEHSTLAHAEPLGIPFSSQCARTADSLTRSQARQSSNMFAKGVLKPAELTFQPLRRQTNLLRPYACAYGFTTHFRMQVSGGLYGIQHSTVLNTWTVPRLTAVACFQPCHRPSM